MLRPLSEHPLMADPSFSPAISAIPYARYSAVPRDGNCLYSSVARLLFPHLRDAPFRARFLGLVPQFEEAGVSYVVHETYTESLAEILSADRRIESISDDEWNLFVGYLRIAVSSHLLLHEEEYSGFLPDCALRGYVRSQVDPMGGRAGQVEIIALARIFGLEISVVYLGDSSYNTMTYGEGPSINILFTPDHFEPIYR